MARIWIAGLLGGVAAFLWGAISHMVLPLGEVGIDTIASEGPLLDAMRASIPSSGLYFFPGEGFDENPKSPAYAAWVANLKRGPRGILVYHPDGADPMNPKQLGLELLTDVAGGLIAAWLVARVVGSYALRAFAVGAVGAFGWVMISASYWIWYGFPGDFSLAQLLDSALSALVMGLVVAKIVKAPALSDSAARPRDMRPVSG